MSAPWSGRRIHFVGVGGAGISAYARAAHALGASVSGSDAVEGPYLQALRCEAILDPSVGHHPQNIPAGADVEVVYSSAISEDNVELAEARRRGLAVHPRAHLLGQLSSMRRTIAVAGTHGKSTTSAMIVHALRAASMRPSWLIGAPIGAGLPNGCWSDGEWLVVEADESDRSMLSLHVEIAVVTNVELEHHATFGSLSELRQVFAQFLSGASQAVVWDRPELLELRRGRVVAYGLDGIELPPAGARFNWRGMPVQLSVPGVHNALNACGALEAARLAGADLSSAVQGVSRFRGAERRFQRLGCTAAGALLVDDYAHHPTEVAATIAAARTLRPARLIAVFQPHLFSRTYRLAAELGRALAEADIIAVLEVYPARERAEDHPSISGLTVAREAASRADGRLVAWLPDFQAAGRMLQGELRDGDLCLFMGAGDIGGLAADLLRSGGSRERHPASAEQSQQPQRDPALRGESRSPRLETVRARPEKERDPAPPLPPIVRREVPLARFCTIRSGGAAEHFANVSDRQSLLAVLQWAFAESLPVSVIGSGSNLLVADQGVPGLVLKLSGGLAEIHRDGAKLTCGGGVRLPALAAYAAKAGLSGIEFGVNIPGTVGGAVRMNANAYGGELAKVLLCVSVATAQGVRSLCAEELRFAYRSSSLRPGEIVAAASVQLVEADPRLIRQRLQQMRTMRHQAQPHGIKTFGSTFKNPQDPRARGASAGMLLSAAGCNGLQVGRARFSHKHANFVENLGGASTEEILAVIAEGRRRVRERFGIELEPEVHLLGPVRFPWER